MLCDGKRLLSIALELRTNQVDFRVYVAREIGEESLFSENLTRLGKGRKIVTDSR